MSKIILSNEIVEKFCILLDLIKIPKVVMILHPRPEGHGGKSCIFDPAVELGTCGKSPYGYTIPKVITNFHVYGLWNTINNTH